MTVKLINTAARRELKEEQPKENNAITSWESKNMSTQNDKAIEQLTFTQRTLIFSHNKWK